MYIYVIRIYSKDEKNITINTDKHLLTFLPIKNSIFPEHYIKIFLAEESPEQITKEHQLIYSGLKIDIKYYCEKILVQNFTKIKHFFEPHKNCSLLYYCQNYDKMDEIFSYFLTILKYCYNKPIENENFNKKNNYSIYESLKNIIQDIQNKKSLYDNFSSINKHYNPCYKTFDDFYKTQDYKLLSNLYEKNYIDQKDDNQENIIFILNKLKQYNNHNWYKNICNLENMIKIEENKNFNITPFSDTTILSFKEDNNLLSYSEFCLKETEEESTLNLVIIFKELYSGQKRLEYDSVKIKLLEKGYFSEFEILSEFMIPKNEKIVNYLKEQIEQLENNNIDKIEKILISFNEYIENNIELIYENDITYEKYKKRDIVSHSDQNQLTNVRRIRVLKNYLLNYTIRKENNKISVSSLFSHFIQFLTIYYPGYNNYFHYRNFSTLMKELGYKSQRKTDGSFILDIDIKTDLIK